MLAGVQAFAEAVPQRSVHNSLQLLERLSQQRAITMAECACNDTDMVNT